MQKLFLLFAALFITHEALAEVTVIIPNLYKNRREGHLSPAATAWSDRRSAGFDYTSSSSEEKTDDVKTEEDSSTDIEPYLYYRFNPQFNVELHMSMYENDNEPVAGADTNSKTSDINANFGWKFAERMVIGANLGTSTTKDSVSGGGSTKDKDTDTGIAYGMQLANDMYFGVGVNHTSYDYDDATATNDTDENADQFYVGLGFVQGDLKKPESAGEVALLFANEEGAQSRVLLAQGLMNQDNLQYIGRISLLMVDNDSFKYKNLQLTGGVDYDFGNSFYLAPELTLGYIEPVRC